MDVGVGERRGLIPLPTGFDPLDPGRDGPQRATHRLARSGGRMVRYIDAGDADRRPLVFFGGLGTSVGAFFLTEFARSLRETLGLRVISVERNGFGETSFDPSLGYDEATGDVLAVLDVLGIERFALVAFSGGGAYAARLAARAPQRLLSLHLAAATAGPLPGGGAPALLSVADVAELARDPRAMWEFPASSPVHRIPGFVTAAQEEGVRALRVVGHGAEALAHEWRLLCSEPLPDLEAVKAPAFLYWGEDDTLVPPAHAQAWSGGLPNVVACRGYPGEAHDVQYRHWDQIMLDAAALGQVTLICRGGKAALVPSEEAAEQLAAGAAVGLCAWRTSDDL